MGQEYATPAARLAAKTIKVLGKDANEIGIALCIDAAMEAEREVARAMLGRLETNNGMLDLDAVQQRGWASRFRSVLGADDCERCGGKGEFSVGQAAAVGCGIEICPDCNGTGRK
jgi:hypothetical protein